MNTRCSCITLPLCLLRITYSPSRFTMTGRDKYSIVQVKTLPDREVPSPCQQDIQLQRYRKPRQDSLEGSLNLSNEGDSSSSTTPSQRFSQSARFFLDDTDGESPVQKNFPKSRSEYFNTNVANKATLRHSAAPSTNIEFSSSKNKYKRKRNSRGMNKTKKSCSPHLYIDTEVMQMFGTLGRLPKLADHYIRGFCHLDPQSMAIEIEGFTPDKIQTNSNIGYEAQDNKQTENNLIDYKPPYVLETATEHEFFIKPERVFSTEQSLFVTLFDKTDSQNISPKRTPPAVGTKFDKFRYPIEYLDGGSGYYRKYFLGQDHTNYFGEDKDLGYLAISIKRESIERSLSFNIPNFAKNNGFMYRIIARCAKRFSSLRGTVPEDAIPSSGKPGFKGLPPLDILEYCLPTVQLSCLFAGNIGESTQNVLCKVDEQMVKGNYQCGILFCRAGQSQESEIYNNEVGNEAFTEFLETIGNLIVLKGFSGHKASLDTVNNTTGLHSVATSFNGFNFMFHVSTLLPFSCTDDQQVARKRHIGNNIVTIVFQDTGSEPFDVNSVQSQMQHIFIVVRVVSPVSTQTEYMVSVCRHNDVESFGPYFAPETKFKPNSQFRDFILTKVINAFNAGIYSASFLKFHLPCRENYIKDLVLNHSSNTPLVNLNTFKVKLASFSSRLQSKTSPLRSSWVHSEGIVTWPVFVRVEDMVARNGSQCFSCTIGLSREHLLVLDMMSSEFLLIVKTQNIIAFSVQDKWLHLFYDTNSVLHVRTEERQIQEILNRLAVINHIASQTLQLQIYWYGINEQGFNFSRGGMITYVGEGAEPWATGLRKGQRIVQIGNEFLTNKPYKDILEIMENSRKPLTLHIIPANYYRIIKKNIKPSSRVNTRLLDPSVFLKNERELKAPSEDFDSTRYSPLTSISKRFSMHTFPVISKSSIKRRSTIHEGVFQPLTFQKSISPPPIHVNSLQHNSQHVARTLSFQAALKGRDHIRSISYESLAHSEIKETDTENVLLSDSYNSTDPSSLEGSLDNVVGSPGLKEAHFLDEMNFDFGNQFLDYFSGNKRGSVFSGETITGGKAHGTLLESEEEYIKSHTTSQQEDITPRASGIDFVKTLEPLETVGPVEHIRCPVRPTFQTKLQVSKLYGETVLASPLLQRESETAENNRTRGSPRVSFNGNNNNLTETNTKQVMEDDVFSEEKSRGVVTLPRRNPAQNQNTQGLRLNTKHSAPINSSGVDGKTFHDTLAMWKDKSSQNNPVESPKHNKPHFNTLPHKQPVRTPLLHASFTTENQTNINSNNNNNNNNNNNEIQDLPKRGSLELEIASLTFPDQNSEPVTDIGATNQTFLAIETEMAELMKQINSQFASNSDSNLDELSQSSNSSVQVDSSPQLTPSSGSVSDFENEEVTSVNNQTSTPIHANVTQTLSEFLNDIADFDPEDIGEFQESKVYSSKYSLSPADFIPPFFTPSPERFDSVISGASLLPSGRSCSEIQLSPKKEIFPVSESFPEFSLVGKPSTISENLTQTEQKKKSSFFQRYFSFGTSKTKQTINPKTISPERKDLSSSKTLFTALPESPTKGNLVVKSRKKANTGIKVMTAEDMNKQKMLRKLRFSNFKSESRQTTSKQSLVIIDDEIIFDSATTPRPRSLQFQDSQGSSTLTNHTSTPNGSLEHPWPELTPADDIAT